MRIIFAGTPEIAATVLRRIIDSPHEIAAVVTRPDAPQGRRRRLTPSPVAALAEAEGLPVVRATRITAEALDEIRETAGSVDLGVVVAYGAILPDDLLDLPAHGWINLHVSLLPRWRGAAPVQRAIAAGDAPLGFSVIGVTSELDAGDVYEQQTVAGLDDATAGEVLRRMGVEGSESVVAVADSLAAGTAHPVAQKGEVTVAAKLDREFGRLSWTQPVAQVFDRWRAATPEPGAWTTLDGDTCKVLRLGRPDPAAQTPSLQPAGSVVLWQRRVLVAAADGWLELLEVQPAGRRGMAAHDWANGLRQQGAAADQPLAVFA
ncbi:methionyl-tRNA formyltransferase [Pseudoclavibacter sp. CFCC 13796]|uniref:methionyl-tRNA formyltransferase n=1 Tax=Pseudoclavibacter sp. CFCC 13796 TaxID=2615179 RepID=UPI0013013158|nr:methionyl-tRNA formyltransferase [Pseudoclavibacter sp. CFCC 13796]KAB1661843.1 methionyl-tRNA formyltransferase [Pseudoclavibacter sp. CFCC 13796]